MSTATVDRVLHARPNVSPQTRKRVLDAVGELERQEDQLAARGRRMFIDVVVEAPLRFSREIRRAIEVELPTIRQAVLRPRFTFHEIMEEEATASALMRIGSRGSHGVLLKARDKPMVRRAITELAGRKIPVVTVFTDIAVEERLAYAGIDNRSAGQTAAYLIDIALPPGNGTVLMTRSNEAFRGEEERAQAFREAMQSRPDLKLVDSSGGGGLNLSTAEDIEAVLSERRQIRAVYSMGGGNRAIVETLNRSRIKPEIFVAHDLDRDNIGLLESRRIDFILHDDLRRDAHAALQHVLSFHRLVQLSEPPQCSDVLVVTPANISRWQSDAS